jgi:sporulation protein YlmC with PRC-barrel domain
MPIKLELIRKLENFIERVVDAFDTVLTFFPLLWGRCFGRGTVRASARGPGARHEGDLKTMKKNMTAFTAALTVLVGAAAAADKIDIRTWTLGQEGQDGWSIKKLIGTKAFGPNRKEIGHVENVIFNPEGKVLKLIVTTGGFLGFDETPLAVNWKDVKLGPDIDYVNTPITVESLDKYGLFDGMPDKVAIGPRQWRATELIGDYVNLQGGIHYGEVRDLIISKEGELKAVIVTSDVGYGRMRGYYAYPYFGYGMGYDNAWNPGNDHYDLPYGKTDIANVLPYAYSKK